MRFLALVLIGSACAGADTTAEKDVLSWFPLQPGNCWTFENSDATQGSNGQILTITWKREECVAEQRRIAEGLLVLINERDFDVRGGAVPRSFHRDYLIRGHDVYEIFDNQWLPGKTDLRPITDEQEPVFRFPLRLGMKWGEGAVHREDNFYCWHVVSKRADTFTLMYRTNPDHTIVKFRQGTGVVSTSYSHHGTYEESRSKLLRFSRSGSSASHP